MDAIDFQSCRRDMYHLFIMFHNMALCYQKMQMLEECAQCIEHAFDHLPTSLINRRFWAPGEEVNTGEYEPYPFDDLFELLMDVKARVHPWIRLNRVVRDIPLQYITGGVDVPNLRELASASKEQLAAILGSHNGAKLYDFLHREA